MTYKSTEVKDLRYLVEEDGEVKLLVVSKRSNGGFLRIPFTSVEEVNEIVNEAISDSVTVGKLVSPPSGFPAFTTLPMPTIYRLGDRRFYVSLDLESLKPPAGVTYYVSPTGNGTGTSVSDPCSVPTAVAKSDVGTIVYLPGEYRREQATAPSALTKSLNHLAFGPGVKVTGWNAALVWTLTSGNIYQTSRSATIGVVDILNRTAWGDYTIYTKKADLASITGPGQWAIVGSTVYVWAIGNYNLTTNPDTILRLAVSARTGITTDTPTVQYVKGISFEGSQNGGLVANGGAKVIAEDCSFKYMISGAGGGNGVNLSRSHGVFVRCEASSNELDGFNYHDPAASVGSEFIEVDCLSHHNGLANPGINNATTAHEDVKGIRVGGEYRDSGGPVVADVNSAKTWNLGCSAGDSVLAGSGSWITSATGFPANPCTMWLDECSASEADYTFITSGGSLIHVHALRASNPNTLYPSSSGVVDFYTPT